MASHRPLYSVQPRRISNIPGLNDQQQMTSVKNWETDNTKSTPKVKIESKVTNSQVCLRCGKEITDLSKVFVGKCCKNQCMCWNCHTKAKSVCFSFRCCYCGQTLYKEGFHLQDLSAVLMSDPPKCDSCDLEVKPEYILPGDHRICSDCFDKGLFYRSVKRIEKMQFFIGRKTHDIVSSMKLFPLQCAHKIVYDNWNTYRGLGCIGCQELLQGNCYELECHHFACLKCCDYMVHCTICWAFFKYIDNVEFRGIQHPNLFNRKVAVAEENKETKQDRYESKCHAHGKICIRITCGTFLCSDCFNEMADRRVSVINGSGAAEEHCICICKPTRGQHIISVTSLIEAESQTRYLGDITYGQCIECCKYTHGIMQLRECLHTLCLDCVSERLSGKYFHRQYNKLHGRGRMFLTCGVRDCTAMVPFDMLTSFIRRLLSASRNIRDTERETAENLVSHAILISAEAEGVHLKIDKASTTGSLNEENEDTSLLPSCVMNKGIDTFSHLGFADGPCCSGTDDGKPSVIKKPSDKDHKRMTAGKSSNASKDKQSGGHKHVSGTTSRLSMESSSCQIEDKLLPPPLADKEQETMDNEAVGSLKITDRENNNNCPSKKRLKTFFNEKPFTDTCSRNKNHQKAIIEFRECGHRLCEDCIEKTLSIKCETVFCGCRTGHRGVCATKVPIEYVVKFFKDRDENNMDCEPTEHAVKRCDNPGCKAVQTSDVDIQMTFPCGHYLCVYCCCDQGEKTVECKVPRYSENINTLNNRKNDKPSLHLSKNPYNRYCDQYSCFKQAVIEFRKCKHRFCEHCVLIKTSGRETVICPYGSILHTCKTQVPTSVIKEYLHNEMNKTICDNPVCKANNESKRDIRKRFSSCGHKLCVICVSEQQHSYEDEVVCMAPACNPRQTEAMDITGIPNVGSTCYASCVLQVLGQTPKFTSMLCEFANGTSKHGVAAHLDELLTHVNKAGNSQNFSVNWDSMNKLMHAIFTLDQSFQRYQENDCHSFIMSLFNALAKTDEDRKEQKPKPIENSENSFLDGTGMDETSKSTAEDSSEGRRSTSHEDGSTARRDDTCPTKLFESRIASKFKYSTCNHTENVADQLFYSLLLSATKDAPSIHCGLDLYFKSEDFTHNQVPCRECTKQDEHTTTSRTPLLSSAPQILMIQLARFGEISRNGGDYKELAKTYHSVEFEKTLRIGPSATADKRELEYELYGVVLHRGNMHGGHYTSCVRNLKSKKWYSCSDSSVSETSEEELLQERAFKHAYLLFYSRKA